MKNQLEMYSFEYNENEGTFHQNFGDHTKNSKGYKTVCETRESIWYPFSNMLKRRYDFYSEKRPSFQDIQKEWDNYLLLLKDVEDYKGFQ